MDTPHMYAHHHHVGTRAEYLSLTGVIVARSPACADQTTAIRTVREAVMWANAARATAPPEQDA